jgi:copper chaperone
METVTLKIDGMTCMGCVGSVTRVLLETAGVEHADVSLAEKRATVRYDPARTGPEQLKTAVEGAGFEVAA